MELVREVDLWWYLPEYLKEFLEMDKILTAEEPEFQMMVENLERLKNSLYIKTASGEDLKIFEKMLDIKPAENDSVENRRKVVLSLWYDTMPYTIRALKARIEIIQGNDDVNVYMDPDDPFLLHVEAHMDQEGQINALDRLLASMVPANIGHSAQNIIYGEASTKICAGIGSSITGRLFLTNDLIIATDKHIGMQLGIGSSITGKLVLSTEIE